MNRNFDPNFITKEVVAARWLFGDAYSRQCGGQVDFWEKLDAQRKVLCRQLVDEIIGCERRSA